MPEKAIKDFFIFREGDGIYLVINAAAGEMGTAARKSIRREIQQRGLDGYVDVDLNTAIAGAIRGEALRIGTCPSDGGPSSKDMGRHDSAAPVDETGPGDADGPLCLDVTEDDMFAFLEVRDGESPVDPELIRAFLREKGVIHGIIDENIDTIAANYPATSRILIAAGNPPVDGEDAVIRNVKQVKTDLTPSALADGRVDFKKLNLISTVKPGDVLKERIPPTKGYAGMDIFGRIIPARHGREIHLDRGDNTYLSVDGLSLMASEDGFIFLNPDGSMSIRAVYLVDGDVDYRTGHIEYKGDIVVKGDVRTGFDVIAGGDANIRGTVENSTVKAERDVNINGGVRSSGTALIMAGRNLNAGFIENTKADAGGDIFVKSEILHSEVRALGSVEIKRHRGRIIGGSVTAGAWIAAGIIGSPGGNLINLAFEPPGWDRMFKDSKKIDARIKEIRDADDLGGSEKHKALAEIKALRVARTEEMNVLFANCFVTAHAIASPLRVRFGDRIFEVAPRDTGITVAYEDLKVRIEESYTGEEVRRRLRKGEIIGLSMDR